MAALAALIIAVIIVLAVAFKNAEHPASVASMGGPSRIWADLHEHEVVVIRHEPAKSGAAMEQAPPSSLREDEGAWIPWEHLPREPYRLVQRPFVYAVGD